METQAKLETTKELLTRLSTSNASTDSDSLYIQSIMRKIGYPKCIVTLGIVYPAGYGEPIPIRDVAQTILMF